MIHLFVYGLGEFKGQIVRQEKNPRRYVQKAINDTALELGKTV